MNQREKILATIIACIALATGGNWFVKHKIVEPLNDKDRELEALNLKLESAQRRMQQARDAEFDLAHWRSLALPGNESTAQTIYYEYLDKLLKDANIEKPSIQPPQARPVGRDIFTKHRFTVNAKMDLKQLMTFLLGFYKTDALHQIRTLDIKPEVEKDKIKTYNVMVAIDAVAMKDADAKFDMPKPKQATYKNTFVDRKAEEFSLFVSKNPFQPSKLVPRETVRVEPRRVDERDERGNYTVTSIVFSNGTPQLWLADSASNKKMFLGVGDDVKIPGFNGKVVDVQSHEAMFEVANDIGVVRLGKNLATWTKLPRTAAAKP